jgi:hypothetical protein
MPAAIITNVGLFILSPLKSILPFSIPKNLLSGNAPQQQKTYPGTIQDTGISIIHYSLVLKGVISGRWFAGWTGF